MVNTNTVVAEAWVAGLPSTGAHLRTDGEGLWSYGLKIGETLLDGTKLVHNYTHGGHGFVSTTTAKHCAVGYDAGGTRCTCGRADVDMVNGNDVPLLEPIPLADDDDDDDEDYACVICHALMARPTSRVPLMARPIASLSTTS